MKAVLLQKVVERYRRVPLWAWEVSLFAVVTPPLLHVVAALERVSQA